MVPSCSQCKLDFWDSMIGTSKHSQVSLPSVRGSMGLTYCRISHVLIFLASHQQLRKALPTDVLQCLIVPWEAMERVFESLLRWGSGERCHRLCTRRKRLAPWPVPSRAWGRGREGRWPAEWPGPSPCCDLPLVSPPVSHCNTEERWETHMLH